MSNSNFITFDHASFSYPLADGGRVQAVKDISFSVERGAHVCILGRNGSGKSTLARMINALEIPEHGNVVINGMNTQDEDAHLEIRRLCGMVFQNPDNQIVGTTIEEDIAFGPENLGVPRDEMRRRIDDALKLVGLNERVDKAPSALSGGQKQKLAIAGILAMRPECIILDEATSMLDPEASAEVMTLVETLRKTQNLTVIDITHDMEAAMFADYIYVMHEGQFLIEGEPKDIFVRDDILKKAGLDYPAHLKVLRRIEALTGVDAPDHLFYEKDVLAYLDKAYAVPSAPLELQEPEKSDTKSDKETLLEVRNLGFRYHPDTPLEQRALRDVSLDVRRGEFIALVGHSGSGKSTLITHFNGLIRPQEGSVIAVGQSTSQKKAIRVIRRHVGLLFQYPEYQLFEETVYKDIAFGPKQLGLDKDEVDRRVRAAADLVGLKDRVLERSPFDLSGGQKRRVAIAGVIAMKPDILVLDEPAAGLDPAGREEILGYMTRLKEDGATIILVTHSMADAARLADRILVLRRGELTAEMTPEELFKREDILTAAGLDEPPAADFAAKMEAYFSYPFTACTPDKLANQFVRAIRGAKGASVKGGSHGR